MFLIGLRSTSHVKGQHEVQMSIKYYVLNKLLYLSEAKVPIPGLRSVWFTDFVVCQIYAYVALSISRNMLYAVYITSCYWLWKI